MNRYQYEISLRIRHPSIAPEEISSALGLQPERSWRAGERRTTPNGEALVGTNRETYWTASMIEGDDASKDLHAATANLLDRLARHGEFFSRVRSDGGKVELFIGWFFDGQSGDVFTSELLARLGGLGIDLSLDVYPAATQPFAMIDAVRAFLEFVDHPPTDSDEKTRLLAAALDRLHSAYQNTGANTFDGNASDPPPSIRERTHTEIGELFPEFGLYLVVDPLGKVTDETMMGDAIDDLMDIRAEMAEVAWRWDNNGADDAQWHFRFSYETHWGRHLIELRAYLHALQFYS